MIWFHVLYSPVKRDFQNDIDTLMSKNQLRTTDDVFTEEDFSHLPVTNCVDILDPQNVLSENGIQQC